MPRLRDGTLNVDVKEKPAALPRDSQIVRERVALLLEHGVAMDEYTAYQMAMNPEAWPLETEGDDGTF